MQNGHFFRRLGRYSNERFNLGQFLPLSLILASFIGVGTQSYLFQKISWVPIVFSTLVFFLFLLRLRIFDEFKDDEHDKQHYPNRPISRGLVSLNELKLILFPLMILELGIALYLGKFVLIMFLVSFVYSLLMFKEFFVKDWLRKHFSIYIFTHEILVIPLFAYLCAINSYKPEFSHLLYFFNLIICAGSFMFLLEIARKVRSKELEIASKDTYTAQYGVLGASILLITVSIISKITLIFNFHLLKGTFLLITVISLLSFAYLLFDVYIFCKDKSARMAKKVFGSSIIFSVVNLIASTILTII